MSALPIARRSSSTLPAFSARRPALRRRCASRAPAGPSTIPRRSGRRLWRWCARRSARLTQRACAVWRWRAWPRPGCCWTWPAGQSRLLSPGTIAAAIRSIAAGSISLATSAFCQSPAIAPTRSLASSSSSGCAITNLTPTPLPRAGCMSPITSPSGCAASRRLIIRWRPEPCCSTCQICVGPMR